MPKTLTVSFMGRTFVLPNDKLGQLAYDYAKAHTREAGLLAAHGTEHRNWTSAWREVSKASDALLEALARPSAPDDHPAWAMMETEFPAQTVSTGDL